ncbi:MAG: AbrB/MazE/SpoVT family DNA-binding domain-containing protein [Candidatus Binataceae bacterium]
MISRTGVDAMSRVTVGKWGKSLAIRVPLDVARAVGLREGEPVEIEESDGDLHVRRPAAKRAVREDALAAVEEIRAAAKGRSLGGITIRQLIDEGRKY